MSFQRFNSELICLTLFIELFISASAYVTVYIFNMPSFIHSTVSFDVFTWLLLSFQRECISCLTVISGGSRAIEQVGNQTSFLLYRAGAPRGAGRPDRGREGHVRSVIIVSIYQQFELRIEGLKSKNRLRIFTSNALWKFKYPSAWAQFSRLNFWKLAVSFCVARARGRQAPMCSVAAGCGADGRRVGAKVRETNIESNIKQT